MHRYTGRLWDCRCLKQYVRHLELLPLWVFDVAISLLRLQLIMRNRLPLRTCMERHIGIHMTSLMVYLTMATLRKHEQVCSLLLLHGLLRPWEHQLHAMPFPLPLISPVLRQNTSISSEARQSGSSFHYQLYPGMYFLISVIQHHQLT